MTRAIIWGLGSLGKAIARLGRRIGDTHIVGVVDTAPHLVGRPLADLIPGAAEGARVVASIEEVAGLDADVLFHATVSEPTVATAQILAGLEAGFSVVSAVEWLFHPWLRHAERADAIDAAARRVGARVTGCGINPGFCFEILPIVLARSTHSLSRVAIIRSADVRSVGPSDFAHLGFGLQADAFAQRWSSGEIDGHVGFPESIAGLAEHVGLALDRITDALEPTLAVRPLDLTHRRIEIGEIVGITQRAQGLIAGQVAIDLTLEMFLDPAGYGRQPREEILIEGGRSFTVKLDPAAPPTDGAATMMLHTALALPAAPPGFVSLLDLPLGGRPALPPLRETTSRRSTAALQIDVAST